MAGMSTQRLLIMVLAINLVLSLSFAVYEAPRVMDYELFGETIDLGSSSATIYEGETASVSPENLQEEGSFGSSLRMGRTIFNLFIRGLIALPFADGSFNSDPIMKSMGYILRVLWSMMYFLIILEGYLIFKNRKT